MSVSRHLTESKEKNYTNMDTETLKQLIGQKVCDTKALIEMGRRYSYGLYDLPRDKEEARNYFEIAAKSGDSEAMFKMGEWYEQANDMEKAFEWFQSSAEHSYPEAIYYLAKFYYYGDNPKILKQNTEKGMELFLKAAQLGNHSAQTEIYHMANQYNEQKEVEHAINTYKQIADYDYRAARELAEIYIFGTVVKQNDNEGLKYIKKIKESSGQQYASNTLYEIGVSFHKNTNYEKAFYWFQEAALSGSAHAMYALGRMYQCGRFVETNKDETISWFKKAFRYGSKDAFYALIDILKANHQYEEASYFARIGDVSPGTQFSDFTYRMRSVDTQLYTHRMQYHASMEKAWKSVDISYEEFITFWIQDTDLSSPRAIIEMAKDFFKNHSDDMKILLNRESSRSNDISKQEINKIYSGYISWFQAQEQKNEAIDYQICSAQWSQIIDPSKLIALHSLAPINFEMIVGQLYLTPSLFEPNLNSSQCRLISIINARQLVDQGNKEMLMFLIYMLSKISSEEKSENLPNPFSIDEFGKSSEQIIRDLVTSGQLNFYKNAYQQMMITLSQDLLKELKTKLKENNIQFDLDESINHSNTDALKKLCLKLETLLPNLNSLSLELANHLKTSIIEIISIPEIKFLNAKEVKKEQKREIEVKISNIETKERKHITEEKEIKHLNKFNLESEDSPYRMHFFKRKEMRFYAHRYILSDINATYNIRKPREGIYLVSQQASIKNSTPYALYLYKNKDKKYEFQFENKKIILGDNLSSDQLKNLINRLNNKYQYIDHSLRYDFLKCNDHDLNNLILATASKQGYSFSLREDKENTAINSYFDICVNTMKQLEKIADNTSITVTEKQFQLLCHLSKTILSARPKYLDEKNKSQKNKINFIDVMETTKTNAEKIKLFQNLENGLNKLISEFRGDYESFIKSIKELLARTEQDTVKVSSYFGKHNFKNAITDIIKSCRNLIEEAEKEMKNDNRPRINK